jgi:hypothetical protein
MKAGLSLLTVFRALKIDRSYIDAVEKASNPAEPRVPAGSGRTSGEWTDSEKTGTDDASGEGTAAGDTAREGTAGQGTQGSSLVLGRTSLPAASFLGELSAAQVTELAAYASRALGPVGAAVARPTAGF